MSGITELLGFNLQSAVIPEPEQINKEWFLKIA
jgi:hypothetical protein